MGGGSTAQAGSEAVGGMGQSAGTGGAGSGGEGGGNAAGGDGSAGMMTEPTCDTGMQDGDETGVDCGGSCEPCLEYRINPPDVENVDESSCNYFDSSQPGGPGFMCPRSMVFSAEFKQAAIDDWNSLDPPFVYGTVGHDPDVGGVDDSSNTCCQCYQLVFESPENASGLPIPKPMIVQAFNIAAGGGNNFDIYMAAGGYGNFNGCTSGSQMYDGFPDLGGDYTGGVRASRYGQCSGDMGQVDGQSIGSAACQDFVRGECEQIVASSEYNQTTSRTSCIETNLLESHYHINWNVRAKRVECPENLTRVTGCKLNGQGLPEPDPTAQDAATADASFLTGYHTTTMQDCCRPTCAWPDNVDNADPEWSIFYTCDRDGNPQTL